MAKQVQAGRQNKSLLKLIDKYYADLADFARQNVLFEMGTRHAFPLDGRRRQWLFSGLGIAVIGLLRALWFRFHLSVSPCSVALRRAHW